MKEWYFVTGLFFFLGFFVFFPSTVSFTESSTAYRSEEFSCCYDNSVNKSTLKITLGACGVAMLSAVYTAGCVAHSSLQTVGHGHGAGLPPRPPFPDRKIPPASSEASLS